MGLGARVWVLAPSFGTRGPLDPGRIPAPPSMTEAVITKVAKQAGVSKTRVWRAWARYGTTLAAGKLAEKL